MKTNEELIMFAQGNSEWAEIEDVAEIAKELLSLRIKAENQAKVIAAFNVNGFADADSMASHYIDARERILKLETALADIQEIADRETVTPDGALIHEIVQCSMDALAKPEGMRP